MFCKGLKKGHDTPLCIEPGISSKLFAEWVKTLDDSADAKVIVTLCAVKSTNNQVDNTEMEDLLIWLLECDSIFLLFDAFH